MFQKDSRSDNLGAVEDSYVQGIEKQKLALVPSRLNPRSSLNHAELKPQTPKQSEPLGPYC